MKLTKTQIKQIIKEEIEAVMMEIDGEDGEEVAPGVKSKGGGGQVDIAAAQEELAAKMMEPMK